jgi:N-methylhydantoinase A
MKRLAVDVGGTFTDFVVLAEDGTVTIEKVPSLPDRPDEVFFEGITRLGVDLTILETIVHGSTMVINARRLDHQSRLPRCAGTGARQSS